MVRRIPFFGRDFTDLDAADERSTIDADDDDTPPAA
jgi:hypothetical protein